MSPSVFFDGSFISSDMNVRSGRMPPAKIFVCFTWPAITAWSMPASFIRLTHVPSWPREIQWIAAPAPAAAAFKSAEASSLVAITVTSWPIDRAASSTRKGKPAVPGDEA